jgi:flagellar hook-associated protein 1 FlgK
LAGATSSADTARADKLTQLENLFQGGINGLGAAVSDMLNAFSDVATSPTDLTARTVALTRISEAAQRMSKTSTNMDDLQQNLTQELKNKITSINTLASGIGSVNEKISRTKGNGQPPNDLFDERDQLIRELNQFIQTSSVSSDDGTVGIFIGGSQALVMGITAAKLSLTKDDFGISNSKLALTRNGQSTTLNENTLAGGEVPGLMRFQNQDMAEARNLLGRFTLAVTTSMNDQHKLGLDMNGNPGGNLFTEVDIGASGNILDPTPANAGVTAADLTLKIADVTKLAASDYELNFSSAVTGAITRRLDGVITDFSYSPATGSFLFKNASTGLTNLTSLDGLKMSTTGVNAVAGDRLLLKPFNSSASNISAEFSTPRALAVASPIAGKMGSTNTGSLQMAGLRALANPAAPGLPTPALLSFTGPNSYTINGGAAQTYTSGQPISTADWSLVLQGAPKAGDTFTVFGVKDTSTDVLTGRPYNNGINLSLNAGNATAMMNLRDVATFDGAALTDGYAGLISQIGIRTQSARYTAGVSTAIADSLEQDRTGVSGVNLDEEAAKLLQFQQAYQASAKVIQIAQGIFDTLIQTVGR